MNSKFITIAQIFAVSAFAAELKEFNCKMDEETNTLLCPEGNTDPKYERENIEDGCCQFYRETDFKGDFQVICKQQYENNDNIDIDNEPKSWACGAQTRLTVFYKDYEYDNESVIGDKAFSYEGKMENPNMHEGERIYEGHSNLDENKAFVSKVEVDYLARQRKQPRDQVDGTYKAFSGLTVFTDPLCKGHSTGTYYKSKYGKANWDEWVKKGIKESIIFQSVLVDPNSTFTLYMDDGIEYQFRNEHNESQCYELPNAEPKAYDYKIDGVQH